MRAVAPNQGMSERPVCPHVHRGAGVKLGIVILLIVIVVAYGVREHHQVGSALAGARELRDEGAFQTALSLVHESEGLWKTPRQEHEWQALKRELQNYHDVQRALDHSEVLYERGDFRGAITLLARTTRGAQRQREVIEARLEYLDAACRAQHILLRYPQGGEQYRTTGPIEIVWNALGASYGVNIYVTRGTVGNKTYLARQVQDNATPHTLRWDPQSDGQGTTNLLSGDDYYLHIESADCEVTASTQQPFVITDNP